MNEAPQGADRKPTKHFVKLAVATALLFGLFTFVVDPREVLVEMLRCSPIAMLATALAIIGGRLVLALRWLLLVRSTHADVSFTELSRLTLMGTSLSFVAPGMIGSDAYRVAGLARTTGVGTAVASVMIERLTSFAGIAFICAIGLALGGLPMPTELRFALFALCLGIVAATLLSMAPPFRRLVDAVIGWLPAPIATKLGRLLTSIQVYAGRPVLLGQLFLLGILLQLIRFLAVLSLAWGLGISVGTGTLLIVICVGMMLSLLPLTPQGLGTREVAYVALLGSVGIAAEPAAALSLLFTAITLIVVTTPALWFYLRHGVWGHASSIVAESTKNP